MSNAKPSFNTASSTLTMDTSSSIQKRKRSSLDYFLLNDGMEGDDVLPDTPTNEVPHGDRLTEDPSQATMIQEVIPEESASQSHSSLSATKTHSWVWQHFQVQPLQNAFFENRSGQRKQEAKIKCKSCSFSTLESKRGNTTSNMKLHLQKHRISDSKDGSTPCNRNQIGMYLQHCAETLTVQQKFEASMIDWFISSAKPFTDIEDPSFVRTIEGIPGIDIPFNSADTLRRRVFSRFAAYRTDLQERLNKTCSTIALSTDCWTSPANKSFLAIIGHWINGDFDYKEEVLEFRELQGRHTGALLAAICWETVEAFDLQEKLIAVTADNAANNVSMVDELAIRVQQHRNKLGTQGIPLFFGDYSFIRCQAHVANLTARSFLTRLPIENRYWGGILGKIHGMVRWVHSSPQRREAYVNACTSKKLNSRLPIADIETRWNSTLAMLEQALEDRQQYGLFCRMEDECLELLLFDSEWEVVTVVCRILRPFAEATRVASQKRAQFNLYVSLSYHIYDHILEVCEKQNEYATLEDSFAVAMRDAKTKFSKYYLQMDKSNLGYVATLADPRLKSAWLRQHLDPNSLEKVLADVQEWMKAHFDIWAPQQERPQSPSSASARSFEDRLLRDIQCEVPHGSDLDAYLTSGIVTGQSGSMNWVLTWWRDHQVEYKNMASVARAVLAIPCGSVSVERLFNGGKDMIGLRRYSLRGETFRILMLLDSRSHSS